MLLRTVMQSQYNCTQIQKTISLTGSVTSQPPLLCNETIELIDGINFIVFIDFTFSYCYSRSVDQYFRLIIFSPYCLFLEDQKELEPNKSVSACTMLI